MIEIIKKGGKLMPTLECVSNAEVENAACVTDCGPSD